MDKNLHQRKIYQAGEVNTGMLYIIVIMLLLFGAAYVITGPTPMESPILTGAEVIVGQPPSSSTNNKRLQLVSFKGATITPPTGNYCLKGGANTRPEIIIGYSPTHPTAVGTKGQIKIWITDDGPLKIASGEAVNNNSGAVITPGDREKLINEYRVTPALFVFPDILDVNGKPFYPAYIRGDFNNGAPQNSRGIENLPISATGKANTFVVQYVWNVKDIGLTPGDYQLQFVIPDSKDGRGIGCISIRVYDTPNPADKIPI